jgi:DNA-sulfur modification-associated
VAPQEVFDQVPDLLREPLVRRGGGIYRGRFEVARPLWVLNPDDMHATASLSIRDIATAAEGGLIWTDQVVQRGVRPENQSEAPVELSLADGYPDSSVYVFYPDKADAIATKLLEGQPGLKLSPLVWNLRPGHFQAAIDDSREGMEHLYLYRGRIYLPDGHHRHQGILKAFRLWEESPDDYPDFDSEKQFTVDIYFMSRRDEAEYFFQKNWLTQQVDRSKSYDLTEQDSLSVLAKRVIDETESLTGNVNRVTDRLAASNPQVITLSTLREVMQTAVGTDALTADEIDQRAPVIARFWDMLATVRPELGRLEVDARRESRQTSMAAQAVLMHGYAELVRRFIADVDASDLESAAASWEPRLRRLGTDKTYTDRESGWRGDFFSRDNPLWRQTGVLQQTKSGGQAVSNVRQTREQVRRALVERLNL